MLDNCTIHHAQRNELVRICARKQVVVKFLAPYNPQFMPIENFFSAVKNVARRDHVREAIVASKMSARVLGAVFEAVGTRDLCQQLIAGCGYYSLV